MLTDQDDLFVRGEADRWFLRNSSHLSDPARATDDRVLEVVDAAGLKPRRVVEIGASNGYRLHALRERFGCAVLALEPSHLVAEDGRRRFPEVRFVRAVASDVPLRCGVAFDLVIVHFVLHWVGRSRLLRSLAEIDRLVADGGHLAIGDFHPLAPERVPYHHLPGEGVWTYKQDYPGLFQASNAYESVLRLKYTVGAPTAGDRAVDVSRQGAVTLLRKVGAGAAAQTPERRNRR